MRRALAGAALVLGLSLAGGARAEGERPPVVVVDSADAPARLAKSEYLSDRNALMAVLATWGAVNIGAGAGMLATTGDDFVRGFGIQAVAWGAVNAIIAGISLGQSPWIAREQHPREDWLHRRKFLRDVFWVNFALDVAYITAGSIMWAAAMSQDPASRDRLVGGTGAGIAVQGAALFLFDGVGAFVSNSRLP
jgi:hypothetical protein